jgi:hypothetical protein
VSRLWEFGDDPIRAGNNSLVGQITLDFTD